MNQRESDLGFNNISYKINHCLDYFSNILSKYESHMIENKAMNATVDPGLF
jgi:hypothetical protein